MRLLKYVAVIFVFIAINLYLGIRLVRQFNAFQLQNGPLVIDVIDPNLNRVKAQMDINDDGSIEVILGRNYGADTLKFSIFNPLTKEFNQNPGSHFSVPNSYQFLTVCYDEKANSPVFRFLECIKNKIYLKECEGPHIRRDIREFNPLERDFPIEDGGMGAPIYIDLDADGKLEVLLRIRFYFYRYPKGIACYDPVSGTLLWARYMGVLIEQTICKDLDNDGKKEIIISTSANNNGSEENGTSDAYSYVIVLDCRGKELWKQVTGTWYTCAESIVVDLDNDGNFEIVTATRAHQVHYRNPGRIFAFDGITGEIKHRLSITHACFSQPFAWKLNNGATRVFVGDSSGMIWMFNQHLEVIKTVKEPFPVKVMNTPSWPNRANDWQYLFASTTHGLMAYDCNLDRKVFEYRYQKPFPIEHIVNLSPIFLGKAKQKNYGLTSTDQFYQISESPFTFSLTLKYLVTTGMLMTITIIILLNGFLIYAFFRLKAGVFPRPAVNNRADTSAFLKALQDIAQQIKTPISTISWTTEKIKRCSSETNQHKPGETYEQLADFLIEDAQILQEKVNHMMTLIRSQKPKDEEK